MTKKEIEIIKEILHITENNPAGYYEEEDDWDEFDESPEDMTVLNASIIRKRCLELLKKEK